MTLRHKVKSLAGLQPAFYGRFVTQGRTLGFVLADLQSAKNL